MRPIVLLGLAAALAGLAGLPTHPSSGAAQAQTTPETASPGEVPIFQMPRSGPFSPDAISIPNARAIAAWARSGHADAASEAFRRWDAEGEIPGACASCHSGAGFRDFHGLDGSAPGSIDASVLTGGVVDCETCHNTGMSTVTAILLPSGLEHPVGRGEAACVTCHQGRASGAQVMAATAGKDDDTPDASLRFVNPHYNIAAATSLGGYGGLGYHYPGKTYSGRFVHAKPVETCVACHDPHALTVAEAVCLTCHDSGAPDAIRIARQSYDGSGDVTKGIHDDIAANADLLMELIRDYAATVAGTPLVYDGGTYPYFLADANGDGLADQADGRNVAYNAFTPRLLRAVFNWKVVNADPGIHVHNAPYALELLYDSIEDLARAMDIDMAHMNILR